MKFEDLKKDNIYFDLSGGLYRILKFKKMRNNNLAQFEELNANSYDLGIEKEESVIYLTKNEVKKLS